jgi:hypothetical protein
MDQESSSGIERRAWIRFGSSLDAVCRSASARREVGWTARLKDISRGGIGLVLRHRFRRGTPLLVELRDHSGNPRVLAARVVRTSVVMDDVEPNWFTGCKFETELTEEEVRELL